jgi:hypothetical protein
MNQRFRLVKKEWALVKFFKEKIKVLKFFLKRKVMPSLLKLGTLLVVIFATWCCFLILVKFAYVILLWRN